MNRFLLLRALCIFFLLFFVVFAVFAESLFVALKVVNITVLTVVVIDVVVGLLSLQEADRQTGRLKLAGSLTG